MNETAASAAGAATNGRRTALRLVVILGSVGLFSEMICDGARHQRPAPGDPRRRRHGGRRGCRRL